VLSLSHVTSSPEIPLSCISDSLECWLCSRTDISSFKLGDNNGLYQLTLQASISPWMFGLSREYYNLQETIPQTTHIEQSWSYQNDPASTIFFSWTTDFSFQVQTSKLGSWLRSLLAQYNSAKHFPKFEYIEVIDTPLAHENSDCGFRRIYELILHLRRVDGYLVHSLAFSVVQKERVLCHGTLTKGL